MRCERVGEDFDGALHVALEDEVEVLHAGLLDLLGEAFERDAGALGELGFALLHLAVLGDALGLVAVGHDEEGVACVGHAFEAEDFDRGGGTGFGDGAAAVVEHGADLAEGVADDVAVAGAEGSVLHEDAGDGAAAAIELGFDDGADGGTVGLGLLLVDVGDEADHLFKLVEVDVLLRGDFDELGVTTLVGGLQAAGGELLDDLGGVGLGLVDLVDGDDDRHVGGAGVVDGLEGLGHDAVVGCNDDDDDVGDLGSAGAHAGEGLVTGGVEEDDLATEGGGVGLGDFDLVGADVLGDAAGFAAGDVGGADGVEERGFAVVDVAHDGDDGRADDFDHAGGVFEEAFDGFVFELLFDGDDGGVGAELAGDVFDQLAFEGLVDGDEDALHEEGGDEVFAADVEFFGEVLDADALGDGDGLGDGKRLTGDGLRRRNVLAAGSPSSGLLWSSRNAVRHGAGRDVQRGACRSGGFARAGRSAGCSAGTGTEAGTCTKGGTCAAGGEAGASGCSAGAGWAAGEGAGGVHGAACAGSGG